MHHRNDNLRCELIGFIFALFFLQFCVFEDWHFVKVQKQMPDFMEQREPKLIVR